MMTSMQEEELIHIVVPGHPADPRDTQEAPEGVRIHYVPELHPDDRDNVDGIPVTSVSRTLIDLAEVLDEWELRECFATARERGMLDLEKLAASRARDGVATLAGGGGSRHCWFKLNAEASIMML